MKELRRHYGRWAGCEEGVHEILDRCIAQVRPADGGGWIGHQCGRKKACPDGFCRQHAKRKQLFVPEPSPCIEIKKRKDFNP